MFRPYSVVFEFNPLQPGRSGIYFGGRNGKFARQTSLEVIQWGKIPLSNPIGKSLEGSKEGDEVKVGPTTFKVLKVN